MLIIGLGILGLIVVWGISVYNHLQTLKTQIKASIQEIGNQLKRQADLIPNLVESARVYLKHEKEIFTTLTEARRILVEAVHQGDTKKMLDAQELVSKAIGGLRVVVESNPQLQGQKVIQRLMAELRDSADKVMYARRTLIDLVADYNRLLVIFPSSLVAKVFGFQPEKGLETPTEGTHLEVTKGELETPRIDLEK